MSSLHSFPFSFWNMTDSSVQTTVLEKSIIRFKIVFCKHLAATQNTNFCKKYRWAQNSGPGASNSVNFIRF